ncbi:MAG: glycosyltransferase, partial [Pedobacter sp.]
MNKLISIVIPAHNEEENIVIIFDRIAKVLLNLNYDYEILVIDDGGSDKTLSIVKDIAERNHRIFY